MDRRPAYGVPPSYVPPPAEPPAEITIQPTQSLTQGYSSQNATGINPKIAFVICPSHILTAFRSLPGIQKCINMQLRNPYDSQQSIILPANITEFNGKHLQVLARNESVNTDGIMKTSLYGGVLSVEKIATIRCLVKNTTVVGITYPEKTGGYNGQYPPPDPIVIDDKDKKLTIIVDQCGLQWQNSIYNTGALFFYPTELDNTVIYEGTNQGTTTTLGKYRQWQNDTYLKMYKEERPLVDAADRDAKWTVMGQSINGKLKSPVVGFKTEFMQAFDSVRFMADIHSNSIKKVHFKFLRAGLGFFSENILLHGDTPKNAPNRTAFLEKARLQGICAGITTLGARDIMAKTKIEKIILPFQTFTIPEMNMFDEFLVTNNKDALEQGLDPEVTIATTNCADPHAGPGNEGRYQSVDAAIASNTYVHHLNAAFNYANIQSITFEEIGTLYSHPAAYPPAATAAVYSPAAAAAAAAAVDQTQDIRIRHANTIDSSQWIPAPEAVQKLWTSYLSDTDLYGITTQHINTNKVMITNTKKVILRYWNPANAPETGIGIMDVKDIKVYLIGPSLPSPRLGQQPMEPGWYPARDYQIFAYLDFMYNIDQPQGVTYFASNESSNNLQSRSYRERGYRLIKNFDGDIFDTQFVGDPIIFTMRRLPNGSICYQKNDAGRTQVMISGIPIEREAYTLEIAAQSSEALVNARQKWRNRPQPPQAQPQPQPPQPALPGSPLQPTVAPMVVAAPMRPIHIPRTPYRGASAPARSPRFPNGLMSDVEAGDDDRECVSCLTNKPNLKFIPCSHCVSCINCYIANPDRLRCLVCRARVTSLALCDEGGAEYQPQPLPPHHPPPPDSPRQRGCFGAYCANNFPNLNRYMLTKHPNASRRLGLVLGGKNKNRKLQKLQKQQKQRATRKHKNKKQSRRRDQRQPRHIRGHGSRKYSYKT
ncbi:unannotated protein [freshwater metagenome]|uniref:Unannotated protein n=1 Tax=freshwater metagenome TaxID=449393 RepID=A0A6J7KXH2_9ZZZZ